MSKKAVKTDIRIVLTTGKDEQRVAVFSEDYDTTVREIASSIGKDEVISIRTEEKGQKRRLMMNGSEIAMFEIKPYELKDEEDEKEKKTTEDW